MNFTKISCGGSSFIVVNNIKSKVSAQSLSLLAKHVCQNQSSVGAQSFVVIGKPIHMGDFQVICYDQNGIPTAVTPCCAVCAARYACDHRISEDDSIFMEAGQRLFKARRLEKTKYQISIVSMDNSPMSNDNDLVYTTGIIAVGSISEHSIARTVYPHDPYGSFHNKSTVRQVLSETPVP